MDERELEQAVRAGLERRAAEADVTAPVVTRARAEVPRRRRTRWSVGAAAAAVVLVVGGIAVATQGGGGDAEEPPVVDDPTTTDVRPRGVGQWRTEYWGPVAVDVPAEWGYGGAPLPYDRLTVCAPAGPPGYVGRPITLTDVCVYLRSGWQPTAPYVWLGADVDPGIHEWDNGYVQETIEVAGTTVTVGTDDERLREEILASARAEHICPPQRDHAPQGRRESTTEGIGNFREAAVCAYRRTDGGYVLSYAATIDESTVEAAWAALDDAPALEAYPGCTTEDEFVVVSSIFNDPFSAEKELWLHWDAVFRPDCGQVDAGPPFFEEDPKFVRMTDRVAEPWVNRGIRSVLSYFIGPQG